MNKRSVFSLLCTFFVGAWIGYYWRDYFIPKTQVAKQCTQQIVSGKRVDFLRSISQENKNEVTSQDCSRKKDVVFMKTHKTGGSTVQNILVRHADKYNDFVGLAKGPDCRFEYQHGKQFKKAFVRPSTRPINMLCHHMIFNKKEVLSMMPNDTIYFSIIRDPSSLFESVFDYFHFDCKSFKKVEQSDKGLKTWISNPESYYKGKQDGVYWWVAKNGMAFDLGFENTRDDDDYIQHVIDEMMLTYHLVLIAEYFEESIILLKDALCWDLEDMGYLQLNSRSEQQQNLDDNVKLKIYKWNKLDTAIYNSLNRTFWKKVDLYGRNRMHSDVEKLRKINAQLAATCVDGDAVNNKLVKSPQNRPFNPKGVQMMGYNLREDAKNNKYCQDVVKTTKKWFLYLLKKQYGV